MITPNVVSWQWSGYARAHASRRNLLLHALTAPAFVAGIAIAVGSRSALGAAIGLACVLAALAAQGHGHGREANAPAPFRSPLDLVVRFVVEQFVTFPRFVLSGGFARAWRASA